MIGTELQDRYRLEAEIGRGAMGAVYAARDLLLDRGVAVKLLLSGAWGAEGRARLLREARAAARLNHPNVAAVYDAGEAPVGEGFWTSKRSPTSLPRPSSRRRKATRSRWRRSSSR